VKLLFDKIFAIFGLIVLFPLLLIVAILIKIKMSDGPILFKQIRVGVDGKLFTIVKFRTMTNNLSRSTVSVKGENRITPLGEKLRKYKIDELPALWNVVAGDMSFVGPRPDVPGYADELKGEERLILKLKPGITGPASLKYRNEEEILASQKNPIKYNDEVIFPDKVRINLNYYYNRNFLEDMKIIFATLFRSDY